jgi:type III secretory pathway component EscV
MIKVSGTASAFGTGLKGTRARVFEVGLASAVVAVVAMMIVPLTPWLLDLLISLNLALSVLVLSLALFVRRPLAFTAFPTLLLVATLYRLALNVSSTRLILLKADAGRIIGGFGGVVVGGDILVGAVIFGILAMVLFLVITKGAERVAEVAARFTLDALPGMQLAIDSDLRSGAVSPQEAAGSRKDLDRQSRYYGSLDGAMKFVRGDAVAGLVIICVNIAGGLSIGIIRKGMSIGQALDTYGRLTIGDGLVTMIPALLISTAAGLLVTRVGQGDSDAGLGDQLGRQLFSEPRAMAAASLLMLLLAAVPGLPAWPFLLFGLGLGAGFWVQLNRERKRDMARGDVERDREDVAAAVASATLEIGGNLYAPLSGEARSRGGWRTIARSLAAPLRQDLGLPIGSVPILESEDGNSGFDVCLKVRGVTAGRMTVPADGLFCLASPGRLEGVGIKPESAADVGRTWIPRSEASLARAAQMAVLEPIDGIALQVQAWLLKCASKLIGIDEAQRLIDEVARTRPVLIRETIPKVISLPKLAELLAALVGDGISLGHLPEVLEVISRAWAGGDSEDLLQTVRQGLAPIITALALNGSDRLLALELDADIESVLENALVTTSRGRRLALSPEISKQIVDACRGAAAGAERPVFLTRPHLRAPLSETLAAEIPDAMVLAHGEIEPNVTVEIAGRVEI